MFKRRTSQDPSTLLPWYANHTLPDAERATVDEWLKTDPHAAERLADVNMLRSAVSAQSRLAPSPLVRQQLLAKIATRRRTARRPAWLIGSAVTLVLLVALWVVIQPGIALQWSVAGTGVSTYRIYRAVAESTDFNLLSEIPATDRAQAYSFTDVTSLPGQTYTYVVEAVTLDGETTLSPVAMGRGLDVLPAQLALILTSLVAGTAAMLLVGTPGRSAPRRLIGI